VGSYQEDPANNPEGPTGGSWYRRLPEADSAFDGGMSFTCVGGQSKNVGTIFGIEVGWA
jgi:hypothetical protein